MRCSLLGWLAAGALALAGCGGDDGGGPGNEGGVDAGPDAGPSPFDGGVDGGPPFGGEATIRVGTGCDEFFSWTPLADGAPLPLERQGPG